MHSNTLVVNETSTQQSIFNYFFFCRVSGSWASPAVSESVLLVSFWVHSRLHLKMVACYYMLMRTIFSYSRELLHPLDEFQIKLSVLFLPWEVVHGSVPSLPKLLLKSYLFHSIARLQEIKGGVPILDREMTVKGFYSWCKNIPLYFFLIEIGLDNSTAYCTVTKI